ncbi:NodT family efflux transporter outer membrane factor (OMF) lipoprotein [Rhodanobacter sp. ANJX3]|uniref:efflux transporter outer membrane subunit n=1 Tax=Rhodanobacter sp. ANJX3 TaxID=2723083 RepID=UPI00182A91C8|nr:efflux transporter outer membrane subunit [Rhodanobacter sp. ANJX3]MBB5360034.1 NodT family efflux transporter outer membrane factor (OMF) lipoprotein [Rhodanobacter sp. ANJX3]
MRLMTLRTAIAAAMLVLVGCTTIGPDFQRPVVVLPDRWSVSAVQTSNGKDLSNSDARWWTVFRDAELSSLVERVAGANLEVEMATTRWMQARAARRMTGADAEPSVGASASYQHARSSQNGLLDISGLNGKKDYNVWQSGFDASWELDLWGRVRREIESADASAEASADVRRGVLLSVFAETARDYIQLRGVQAQQTILRQNLDVARHALRLTQIRLADGVATHLETAEASAQVSAIEAQLPALENDQLRLINALSYLVGRPPRALENELQAVAPIPPVPPAVPLGLPSELAERRPDIRSAEERLHAATADIGVAVGDFYPRIALSADAGLQAMHFSDLDSWSSRMFGVGPALSVPIFEGGRLKEQLALRKAQQQEAMIGFQRTVLAAWHEVDDAMSDYKTRQERHDKLAATVDQYRIALENANRQYVAGATDFLQVLTVQKDLLATQQALAVSSTDVSESLVSLYKALGGGWETTFPLAISVSVPTELAKTPVAAGNGI